MTAEPKYYVLSEFPSGERAYDYVNERLILFSDEEAREAELPLDMALMYVLGHSGNDRTRDGHGLEKPVPELRLPIAERRTFKSMYESHAYVRDKVRLVVPFSLDGIVEGWALKNRELLMDELHAVPAAESVVSIDAESVFRELVDEDCPLADELTCEELEHVARRTASHMNDWCADLDTGFVDEMRDAMECLARQEISLRRDEERG